MTLFSVNILYGGFRETVLRKGGRMVLLRGGNGSDSQLVGSQIKMGGSSDLLSPVCFPAAGVSGQYPSRLPGGTLVLLV